MSGCEDDLVHIFFLLRFVTFTLPEQFTKSTGRFSGGLAGHRAGATAVDPVHRAHPPRLRLLGVHGRGAIVSGGAKRGLLDGVTGVSSVGRTAIRGVEELQHRCGSLFAAGKGVEGGVDVWILRSEGKEGVTKEKERGAHRIPTSL